MCTMETLQAPVTEAPDAEEPWVKWSIAAGREARERIGKQGEKEKERREAATRPWRFDD